MNENLGSDSKIMLRKQFNEQRWFKEAVDMGDSGYGYSPERKVKLVHAQPLSKAPTFKDYEKSMNGLVVYWANHMKKALSLEELNLWREQMAECSISLLNKARNVADSYKGHDRLEMLYQNTSRILVNECDAIYEKQQKQLSQKTSMLQQIRDFFSIKNAIKTAKQDIHQKQAELETLLDGKDVDAIHDLLMTQSENASHQEKTHHLDESDVNSMFRKPTRLVQEINRFKQNKVSKRDDFDSPNDMLPDVLSQNRQ